MDVTSKDEPKQPEKQPEGGDNETLSTSTESPGLSLLTKLIFFGAMVGVVLTFLRSRKASVQEKSLA